MSSSNQSFVPVVSRTSQKLERPDLYQFTNYREFIAEMVRYLRSKNSYSIRKFARANGIGSHSYVKMVVDGQRSLTEDSARKMARGFELGELETEYFLLLIRWNEAPSLKEQEAAYKQMMIFLRVKGRIPISESFYEFFSKAHRVVLYEALTVPRFGEYSSAEMGKRLNIPAEEVETSLKIFENLKMAKYENGRWVQCASCVETNPEMRSLAARRFHKEVLSRAVEAIDKVSVDERNLQSLTLALSQAQYREIVETMTRVLKETNAQFSENSEATRVYHLSLQIFPAGSIED